MMGGCPCRGYGANVTTSIGPCFFSFFSACVLRLGGGVIFLSNSAGRVETVYWLENIKVEPTAMNCYCNAVRPTTLNVCFIKPNKLCNFN